MKAALKLYFSPLACSLASRIALYEAGADVSFSRVDPKTKLTDDGRNYASIHSLGLVPSLECEQGVLTENAAILQFVAERFPDAALAPNDAWGRTRLRQWLSFIGSELHKALFGPLLEANAADEVRRHALVKADSRLRYLSEWLDGRSHLLDGFSVADAYLFAVLNWTAVTPIDLTAWPVLRNYQVKLAKRPSIARAFAEERALYSREPQ